MTLVLDRPSRPVMRYHGGKWRLAPWILEHSPPHRVYVEPFGGAASVLLQKPRSYAEVYNDKCGRVVNIFRVLRDPASAADLERRLRLTPFARDEFTPINEGAYDAAVDDIDRARIMIFRSFAGFGSNAFALRRSTGFRGTSNRSGTTPAHDWANFADCIPTFIARLRGVVIENREASAVMQAHDGRDTLHYVDPPYVHSTRSMANPYDLAYGGYSFELSDAEHEVLAGVLHELSGMVVLSGYRCDLYDRLFSDWQRIDTVTHADGARERCESLWLNPAATTALGQPRQLSIDLESLEGGIK